MKYYKRIEGMWITPTDSMENKSGIRSGRIEKKMREIEPLYSPNGLHASVVSDKDHDMLLGQSKLYQPLKLKEVIMKKTNLTTRSVYYEL